MIKVRRLTYRSVIIAVLVLSAGSATADESGAAFWLSGQYASMAAVPPPPGWSLASFANVYRGTQDNTRISSSEKADIKAEQAVIYFEPGYAFETEILGGTPYVSISAGYGSATTSLQADGTHRDLMQSQTVAGAPDLNPFASLSWSRGVNNVMTYLSLNVPVGQYNPEGISNLGLGHAALDWGAAYTYLDANTGWEFSALAGLTYNWENPQTKYQSGIDSHLDWGASRWINKNWQLGIAGYVYYQLTNDTGSGDDVGANRARVAGIGPQIGYQQQWNNSSLYVSLRGYQEFWARNRTEGQSFFLVTSYSWLK